MTSKITSMNSILMIDWLNSSLIKSTKSTYHLVTFKCSKKKYQNKAYGSEQILYMIDIEIKQGISWMGYLMITNNEK